MLSFHMGNSVRMVTLAALALVLASGSAPASEKTGFVRFATFNASLNRGVSLGLIESLESPNDPQIQAVAEIIQRVNPDVLLLNEFDYDELGPNGESLAAALFQENYLSVSQNGAGPIAFKYRYAFPSNTGIHSSEIVGLPGLDLNKDGIINPIPDQGFPGFIEYGDDSLGFGAFPGQFAFVVYSKYPILADRVRTFQYFLWKDMPGARLPVDPDTGDSFYTEQDLGILPLSSKNHVDVPIRIKNRTIHFLISHPTPPVFDGPEDRNGTRNADEIRFWADYVGPWWRSWYIYDDSGRRGGLRPGAMFVIAGDQNADPFDGDSLPGAIQQLLEHPRINASHPPLSEGAVDRNLAQHEINDTHLGDPAADTADFAEAAFGGPGNLRVDYVLPSRGLPIVDTGVFWPADDDPLTRLTGPGFPPVSSDHRLVYVDIAIPRARFNRGRFDDRGERGDDEDGGDEAGFRGKD